MKKEFKVLETKYYVDGPRLVMMLIEVAGCKCGMCKSDYHYCPYTSIIRTIEDHRDNNRHRAYIVKSFKDCVKRWDIGDKAVEYAVSIYPEYAGLWEVIKLLM